jgi:outer membrane autotransporter protein
MSFATEIRAEWQHEFLDDSHGIDADLIGSGLGSFQVKTSPPESDAALVGAGINFTFRNTLTVFCDYDVQTAQRSYFEQSVKAGLRFGFY